MRRLAKIALLLAIPMSVWGLVGLGAQGAFLFGGFTFGISCLVMILLQEAWTDWFGGETPAPSLPPKEVLQEVAAMREPGAPRVAFWLQVAHLPGGSRQSVRIRIWDEPDWRGSVWVHEKRKDQNGMVEETVLRDGDLPAEALARLRDALERFGAPSLKHAPIRSVDGSPASLYVVERGMEPIPSGSMNLFHLHRDPIFDPATHAFFMAVLDASGLLRTAENS